MIRLFVTLLTVFGIGTAASAQENPAVRVGILEYGTVSWELDTLTHHGFDEQHGISVEPVPFAGEDATAIALRSGNVDVIVSDWLWVSRLRSEGEDFVFTPFSTAAGAVMVPPDSPLESLEDLENIRMAVAGGPLDKSWLMLRGVALEELGRDLEDSNEMIYGAPPLLSEMARAGRVDALLTFWHHAARLEADGFRRLISAEEAASRLGAQGPVSVLGYVFRQDWAENNPELITAFLAASADAKSYLDAHDEEWERLQQAGRIPDSGEALQVLRDQYRAGIPRREADEDRADAALIYRVLAELGGRDLVGDASTMEEGTYWDGGR